MSGADNFLNDDQDELVRLTAAESIEYQDEIKSKNIPLWRINKSGQKVIIPIEKITDYIGANSGNLELYVQKNWKDILLKQAAEEHYEPESTEGCLQKIKVFHKMSFVEREEILDDSIETLHYLNSQNKQLDLKAITDMVDVIVNTIYINNATLEENEAAEVAQANINGVIVKTKWVIDSLIKLVYNKAVLYSDFNKMSDVSSGSVSVDQISTSFMRFLTFCLYYNEFIETGKISAIIRKEFRNKYYRYYKNRLPDLNVVTLETVFDGGIRRLTDEEIQNYCLGALLHDIGKLTDLKYHDGDKEFEAKRVKIHVLLGYNMIINSKGFPFEVAAMTAFHHEYYNDKDGYNFTKAIMRRHKMHIGGDDDDMKYFISYGVDDFLKRKALACFPCKMLEIIDVFTALYEKRQQSAVEALSTMKKDFIVAKLKVDPVLFEIFMNYLKECRLINDSDIKEVDSII